MDFTQFDSRAAAAKGQPLHLVHPSTGEPLYCKNPDGTNDLSRPCRVFCVGSESRAAQAALTEVQRAKMKSERGSAKTVANRTLEELHTEMTAAALVVVTGFENVYRGDTLATKEDAEWFFGLQLLNGQADEKSFVEQVTAFSTKRANFLGNGSPL